MPKAFLQGLSTLLSGFMVAQMAFGSLALAQSTPPSQPGYNNDPFWSDKQTAGGQVNPNDPNYWFNDNSGGLSNDPNDPFGNWNDPNSSDPFNTGNFGGQTDDPFGVYGGWNSGTYMTSKMTDPFFVKLMRMTGVLNKNYSALIHQYREQYSAYGTENDDSIADIIIQKHSREAGLLGAGAAVMPTGMDYIWKEWRGQQATWGYGIGIALGGLTDFMAIIAQEASMMFELQALYGELPTDDDDRTASTILPFILGMGGASLNKLVSHKLRLDVNSGPTPPAPSPDNPFNPGPNPAPAPAPVTPPDPAPIVPPAPGPSEINVTKNVLANPVANETAQLVEWATLKGKLVEFFMKRIPGAEKIVKGKTIAAHLVETMPPVFRVIASAILATGISYETNKKSCYYFGQWAKRYYKSMHQVELASVIHQLRSNPEAKAVLWLVLLTKVFNNRDMQVDDSKMYAAIMMQEMPLIQNSKWDELASIQHDYRDNPEIIDQYLTDLRNDLPIDAKLYMVKLIIGGMLMKGGMNGQDIAVLKNFAVSLGLYEPPKTNFVVCNIGSSGNCFRADDQRVIDRDRYLELVNRMRMDVVTAAEAKTSKLAPNKNYVTARWGRSGQIVLEDYENSTVQPMIDFFDRVKANGGLDPSTIKQANQCGNNAAVKSGQPATNLNNPPGSTPFNPFDENSKKPNP